jgi:hypothetical protein
MNEYSKDYCEKALNKQGKRKTGRRKEEMTRIELWRMIQEERVKSIEKRN